ncbi:MAG: tetratricopeptide repeat protein [Nitrospirota bacterium]|nr:tetratricopeptide repeat protein [Nitrospirota bacterium]
MNAMILCRTMLVVVFLMMTPSGSWAKEKNASLAELQQQAKKGQANAQYKLGVLYDQGQGVKQDYGQARKWWLKAAEQGNAAAQVSLGLLYNKSHGVKQDYGQARKWWLKAAEEGNANAQVNLAVLYSMGRGVPEDLVEAYAWANVAAGQGLKSGVTLRKRIKQRLAPASLAEAQAQSKMYHEKYAGPNR